MACGLAGILDGVELPGRNLSPGEANGLEVLGGWRQVDAPDKLRGGVGLRWHAGVRWAALAARAAGRYTADSLTGVNSFEHCGISG